MRAVVAVATDIHNIVAGFCKVYLGDFSSRFKRAFAEVSLKFDM